MKMKRFVINFMFDKTHMCLNLLIAMLVMNPMFLCMSQAKELPSADQFVVFKNGVASTCGFLGRQGDKTYVFTSMHGLGNTGFNLYTKDGKQLKTGTVELASDRDIVRIAIEGTPGNFFELDNQVQMAQAITVVTATSAPMKMTFGIDSRAATVDGIGPEFFSLSKIDKSSYILSGSPVINAGGKVTGIVSCDIPVPLKADPKTPDLLIKVNWGNAVCSRFSDDISWISVNKRDLIFQLNTLDDSRGLVDDYLSVSSMWYSNPYEKIKLAAPRVEIKAWVADHNRKMENSARNIADIAKDPNHFQALAKQMQESARNDGLRLSAFASTRATATGNSGLTPYMKYYASGMSVFFDEIARRITSKASSMTYMPPSISTKK
jgi:hypothetical protein